MERRRECVCPQALPSHPRESPSDQPFINALQLLRVAANEVSHGSARAQAAVQLEHVPETGPLVPCGCQWSALQVALPSPRRPPPEPTTTLFGHIGQTRLLQGLVIYQVLDLGCRAVHIGVLEGSRRHRGLSEGLRSLTQPQSGPATWSTLHITRPQTHLPGGWTPVSRHRSTWGREPCSASEGHAFPAWALPRLATLSWV